MQGPSILPHFTRSVSAESWFRPEDDVRLKIFEFRPVSPVGNIPIVLITGLVTKIDSFRVIVEGLSALYPVYYFESRDKTTSVIDGRKRFDIVTMGKDLSGFVKEYGLEKSGYCLIGYSMGASIIADCYRSFESGPQSIIFMEPTPEFNYPGWSRFLIRFLALPFYGPLKALAKWHLGKFYINRKEDEQMAVISSNSLESADPVKLRRTILDIAGYKVYPRLADIKCPVLVVGTSKDSLHVDEQIRKMVGLIEKVEFIDLETNDRTHNDEMVKISRDFISRNKPSR